MSLRISALEQEILCWLAVAREPVTVQTLRADLVQPPPVHLLLDALRSLQRHSLLEKAPNGFTLQNVIMEYVTDRVVEGLCAELLNGADKTGGQGDRETGLKNLSLSPYLPISLSMLNRHALLKASAKEYVRQSQARLILQPIA